MSEAKTRTRNLTPNKTMLERQWYSRTRTCLIERAFRTSSTAVQEALKALAVLLSLTPNRIPAAPVVVASRNNRQAFRGNSLQLFWNFCLHRGQERETAVGILP
jgi:hypothetical protein